MILCDYCPAYAYHTITETTANPRTIRLCQGHTSIFAANGWLVDKSIQQIKQEGN